MYESLSTFTSLERDWNLALLQSKTLLINIYYNTKMGESTSKFDFERIVPVFFARTVPFDFFARIVPVESSQGGTGFCAKRPVTVAKELILAIFVKKELDNLCQERVETSNISIICHKVHVVEIDNF